MAEILSTISSSTGSASAPVVVENEALNRRLADYVRVLATHHPFSYEIKGDERQTFARLKRQWLGIPEYDTQAEELLSIINQIITTRLAGSPPENIILRVTAAAIPLTPQFLPAPMTVASFDASHGVMRRRVVPMAKVLPALDDMAISSGIIVIRQPMPVATHLNMDDHPHSPMMANSENGENSDDFGTPIDTPWPGYLLTFPAFVEMYYELFPNALRPNPWHHAETVDSAHPTKRPGASVMAAGVTGAVAVIAHRQSDEKKPLPEHQQFHAQVPREQQTFRPPTRRHDPDFPEKLEQKDGGPQHAAIGAIVRQEIRPAHRAAQQIGPETEIAVAHNAAGTENVAPEHLPHRESAALKPEAAAAAQPLPAQQKTTDQPRQAMRTVPDKPAIIVAAHPLAAHAPVNAALQQSLGSQPTTSPIARRADTPPRAAQASPQPSPDQTMRPRPTATQEHVPHDTIEPQHVDKTNPQQSAQPEVQTADTHSRGDQPSPQKAESRNPQPPQSPAQQESQPATPQPHIRGDEVRAQQNESAKPEPHESTKPEPPPHPETQQPSATPEHSPQDILHHEPSRPMAENKFMLRHQEPAHLEEDSFFSSPHHLFGDSGIRQQGFYDKLTTPAPAAFSKTDLLANTGIIHQVSQEPSAIAPPAFSSHPSRILSPLAIAVADAAVQPAPAGKNHQATAAAAHSKARLWAGMIGLSPAPYTSGTETKE